jgi:hypothetical protein
MAFVIHRKSRTKHGAHLPPVAASPLEDPLHEPWESSTSNETGFHARFEVLYQHPLPLAHPPCASVGVVEVRPTIVDPRLCHIHV